jgi:hypothetical protein
MRGGRRKNGRRNIFAIEFELPETGEVRNGRAVGRRLSERQESENEGRTQNYHQIQEDMTRDFHTDPEFPMRVDLVPVVVRCVQP